MALLLSAARVLVVDDSMIFRDMLERVLAPHCREVLSARNLAEGVDQLRQNRDLSLVLSDVLMPDGDGFDLLQRVRELDDPKPEVILITARVEEADAKRASELGAIGYLPKPTTLREISRVLRRSHGLDWNASRPPRRRTLGKAHLEDPRAGDASHIAFEVRDLSTTGAFLETKGPVPVGTELDLCLVLGAAMAHVRAVVVRVQDPSWAHVGGIGVRFTRFFEGSERLVENYVSLGEDQY